MYDDRTTSDRLIESVVVDNRFVFRRTLLPDFDPERIWIVISSPDHKFVVAHAVDRTRAFEFAIVAAGDYQPIVTGTVASPAAAHVKSFLSDFMRHPVKPTSLAVMLEVPDCSTASSGCISKG